MLLIPSKTSKGAEKGNHDQQAAIARATHPMTDAAVTSRADELIAAMTTAEKAGQLTQHFYFGFQ